MAEALVVSAICYKKRVRACYRDIVMKSSMAPWSFGVSANSITCGAKAYAELLPRARFTTTIKLHFPGNVDISVLVDTGADRSCVSDQCFALLRSSKPSISLSPAHVFLTNANGLPMTIKGSSRLTLPLTPHISVTSDLLVCKDLLHEIIIGMDILLSTRAVIDLHDQSILFRSPEISVAPERVYFTASQIPQRYLTLTEDVKISPRSHNLIQVPFLESKRTKPFLVHQNYRGTSPYPVAVASMFVTPKVNRRYIRLLITNPSNQPIILSAGTRIAHLTSTHTVCPTRVATFTISDYKDDFCWDTTPPDVVISSHSPGTFLRQIDDEHHDAASLASLRNQVNPSLSATAIESLVKCLESYKDIFASNPNAPRMMRHVPPVYIDTDKHPPIKAKQFRRHPLAHRYIDEQTAEMEREGLVEKSTSPWCFPVVLALKPNGKLRFCIDYRQLNDITTPDAYRMPRLDDTLDLLHGKSYFSTLDAASGFHQIPLDAESRPKTAFATRSGLYQWLRLPFGWINAPPLFQRTMDFVLHGLSFRCALVYMDDIIVYSASLADHIKDLSQVLQRLRHFNCQLKLAKCHFAFHSIEYHGHIVSSKGVSPRPSLVAAVMNFPSPANETSPSSSKAAVKRFLAMANFYRRFIRGFATITAPLVGLTRKKQPFVWTESHQKSFTLLKDSLVSAPVLAFPHWSKPFHLSTDASEIGTGAVLEQFDESGKVHPVQYLSYRFKNSEQNWSMPEKELFAFVFAVRKFQVYLYGRPFQWYTDASSLQWLRSARRLTPKLLRWALTISGFAFTINFKAGKTNVVADTLSRHPTDHSELNAISLHALLPSSFQTPTVATVTTSHFPCPTVSRMIA